jgi:hypothetical protein
MLGSPDLRPGEKGAEVVKTMWWRERDLCGGSELGLQPPWATTDGLGKAATKPTPTPSRLVHPISAPCPRCLSPNPNLDALRSLTNTTGLASLDMLLDRPRLGRKHRVTIEAYQDEQD